MQHLASGGLYCRAHPLRTTPTRGDNAPSPHHIYPRSPRRGPPGFPLPPIHPDGGGGGGGRGGSGSDRLRPPRGRCAFGPLPPPRWRSGQWCHCRFRLCRGRCGRHSAGGECAGSAQLWGVEEVAPHPPNRRLRCDRGGGVACRPLFR